MTCLKDKSPLYLSDLLTTQYYVRAYCRESYMKETHSLGGS